MSFELFLLCAGTFATGVSIITAFLYMRSQKRALIDSETEIYNETSPIQKIEAPVNETKIDIKIVGGNITLTARDMDVEILERLIDTLTAKQIDAKIVKSVN